MKKQIVINASKDRSRIAIVEDGELVELYVENPDNVRTIGNIYLGRVQKVMPAIRAAFVDVGQKQDCFLHFSDLTDNFPQLLAMAGEEVPGLDEPVLSLAPAKRVADDEDEPDIEETLEVEEPKDESRSRRTRGRRSRGRGRGRGRSEEEEEQEERTKPLPGVIDLTSSPRKPKPAPELPAETRASEDSGDAEETPPKRRSRSSSKKSSDATEKDAEDTDDSAASDETSRQRGESASDDEGATKKRKRRRRGRRGRSSSSDDSADASSDDEDNGDAEAKDSEPKKTSKKRSSRADGGSSDTADTPEPSATGESGSKRLPSSIDLSSSGSSRRETSENTSDETKGRSRRQSRSRSDESEARAESADDTSESTSGQRQGKKSDNDNSDNDNKSNSRRRSKDSDADGDSTRSRRRSRGDSNDTSDSTADDSDKDERRWSRDGSSSSRSSGRNGSSERDSRKSGSRTSIPSNEQLLKRDGRVIVKITKEPISTKGPRVSTDLSMAGRFLVLVPAADYVAVSKKIESAKERRRLRTLASSLKPDRFGVIVRTVAEGRDAKELDTDLRLLVDKWRKIDKKLQQKPQPPVLLYEDVNMVSSVIRDLFSDDYDRILVDDPKVFKNVQAYVKAVAPQMADKVELHRGQTPAFRSVGIERQVEEAFSKRVNMRGGGYLYIETTEAMHVVDVNSGRAGRGKSQKENLIAVNVEAAREVAKQLRLRDLGGIIVVDFIDLRYDRDRKKVTDALKEAFKKDRAVTKLLPMSDFGLVQITRQRLRPSITTQAVDEDGEPLDAAEAAEAAGAGEIQRRHQPEPEPDDRDERRDSRREEEPERPALAPEDATPQALSGRLRGWLDHYRRTVDDRYKGRPIVVRVHPLFGAYLRRGFPSPLTRWRLALRGIAFHLEEDASVNPLAFEVRDQKSGRSLLKKYAA